MLAHALTFGYGLLLYGLVIGVSLLAGLGLLRLIRLPLRPPAAVFFAPVLTLAFWSVALGLGVVLGSPVRYLAVVLWPLTIGLALYGAARTLALARLKSTNPPPAAGFAGVVALCALLPVAVLFPYFWYGLADYAGSTFPDGWSYVAVGQYLWVYPWGAGVEGGLSPLHQYATHLAGTRFVASAMLGYFSPLFTPGDTQAAQGLFLAWGLFVFASSCAFLGLVLGLRPVLLAAYLVLTVASGWVCNLLHANNYDNGLALPYFPALLGAVIALGPGGWSWRVVLAWLGAGLLYCYPELTGFVFGGAFIVASARWWRERRDRRGWALTLGCAAALMLALTAPFLPGALAYVRHQAASTVVVTGIRPGEGMFAGLLSLHFQPSAFWALGGEYEHERFLPLANLVGILLSLLAGVGLLLLWRRGQRGLAAVIVLLLAGAGVMVFRQHYSYGAYKFILLGWWGVGLAAVLGLEALVLRGRPAGRPVVAAALAAVCALGFGRVAAHWDAGGEFRTALRMSEYRSVRELGGAVGDAPVIVAVDDWVASEWAVYFLHDRPIDLQSYRMYMGQAHVVPEMRRARVPAPGETPYVLTDDSFAAPSGSVPPWKLVWSGGPYRLWAPSSPGWALLNRMGHAAVQPSEGKLVWRLGPAEVTVEVVAGQAGVLRLVATLLPGPGAAGAGSRTFLVSTDGDYREELTLNGEGRVLSIPVRAGATKLTMRALDLPPTARAGGAAVVVLDPQGVRAGPAD